MAGEQRHRLWGSLMYGDTREKWKELLMDRTKVLGPTEVDQVIDDVMNMERDSHPPDDVWETPLQAAPGRVENGRIVDEADYRLRYQQISMSYMGLIDGGKLTKGALAEKVLMALVERRTSTLEPLAGDWQILAFTRGREANQRSRRQHVGNAARREWDAKGFLDGDTSPGESVRVPDTDMSLSIRVCWYDRSCDIEVDPVIRHNPAGGVITQWIRSGFIPHVIRVERQDCLETMRMMRDPKEQAKKLTIEQRDTIGRLLGACTAEVAAKAAGCSVAMVRALWGEDEPAKPAEAAARTREKPPVRRPQAKRGKSKQVAEPAPSETP